jgi:hypothetical protein
MKSDAAVDQHCIQQLCRVLRADGTGTTLSALAQALPGGSRPVPSQVLSSGGGRCAENALRNVVALAQTTAVY